MLFAGNLASQYGIKIHQNVMFGTRKASHEIFSRIPGTTLVKQKTRWGLFDLVKQNLPSRVSVYIYIIININDNQKGFMCCVAITIRC